MSRGAGTTTVGDGSLVSVRPTTEGASSTTVGVGSLVSVGHTTEGVGSTAVGACSFEDVGCSPVEGIAPVGDSLWPTTLGAGTSDDKSVGGLHCRNKP